jgi:hypothetical protein
MNRFLLSVAAMGLSLALVGTAVAAGPHGSKSFSGGGSSHGMASSYSHGSSSSYHMTYGSKLPGGGYSFKGKDHRFWSYRSWDKRYGCYCYWYPGTSCYYYWCEPDECYYPIAYCPYGKYCW